MGNVPRVFTRGNVVVSSVNDSDHLEGVRCIYGSMIVLALFDMYELVGYNIIYIFHIIVSTIHIRRVRLAHNVLLPCSLMFLYPTSIPHCKCVLRTTLPLHLVDNVLRMLTPTSPK